MEVPRLHIVGRKNSGKTSLVCALVRELTARGYNVATLKHTGHNHPIDAEGKDTWQHRKAGAISTVMLMPTEFAVFSDRPDEEELMKRLSPWLVEADLVLVEGWSGAHGRCIEIRASEDAEPVLPETSPDLLAYAADFPIPTAKPLFSRSDVSKIADFAIAQTLEDR